MTPEQLQKRREQMKSPVVKPVMKYGAKVHVAVYRATRGRIGRNWRIGAGFRKPVPVVLLDHVGRKSGTTYTTPLLHLVDGDRWVVVASQGGMATDPQWFRNLMANPDTTVQRLGEVRKVHASVVGPVERTRLWPLLVDLYADFATYQELTDRVIPVVILSPR